MEYTIDSKSLSRDDSQYPFSEGALELAPEVAILALTSSNINIPHSLLTFQIKNIVKC